MLIHTDISEASFVHCQRTFKPYSKGFVQALVISNTCGEGWWGNKAGPNSLPDKNDHFYDIAHNCLTVTPLQCQIRILMVVPNFLGVFCSQWLCIGRSTNFCFHLPIYLPFPLQQEVSSLHDTTCCISCGHICTI